MIENVFNATLEGNVYDIAELIQAELDGGVEPQAILKVMMSAMEQCGKKFEVGEYFLPELMMAADAFKVGMEVLAPRLAGAPREYVGKVVLGTVQGDIHDIGKNLVGFMLESAGYQVINLGVDVTPEAFVQAVKDHSPDILGMSALLTTTMLGMKDIIEELKRQGLREQVKVMIGGAPVSKRVAEEIGADAYGNDAGQAIELARSLMPARAGG